MSVRMKDIATDLGVSLITVSKVLHNHPDISESTRRRVLQHMRERNYQPNLSARALVTGKTSAVGLIVPDLVHPFFAEVAMGLSGTLRGKGYDLMIGCSEENPTLENKEIEQMLARRVDALVLASVQHDPKSFRRIQERGIPSVLIDRHLSRLHTNFVGVDNERVGTLATDHLIEVGCRFIAHISGPRVSTVLDRAKGYRRSLLRHGLDAPAEYIAVAETGDESLEISSYRAMVKLLHADARPDGVFCYSDPCAMGAMHAILEAGLRIPEDVAVIGCGNIRFAAFLRVPLSSVDLKSAATGSRAGELAIAMVESKSAPRPARILLEPTLVARASTRRNLIPEP